jgi:anaphase-promoting complex subunit 4
MMRVVREMKGAWFGSDTATGARELGPRWVNALKAKQKTQFGRMCSWSHLRFSS